MNEPWKRLIEAERRIMRLESLLQRQNTKIVSVAGALNNDGQNITNPFGSGGGGGTGSGFRWETRYRIRCVFNTAPAFSSSGSANATLDSEAFNYAVDFLSQWHEFESWEYPESPATPYRYAEFYTADSRSLYHNVGDTIEESDWQRWFSFSKSAFKRSDATHLIEYAARARVGYFPENYRVVIGPDEIKYTGANKYIPDITYDYKNITQYWTNTANDNWYDRYPNLYLGEWESTNQSVTNKWVHYNKYDSLGDYSGFYTLQFARSVIDDMTEEPVSPFVFGYGPEAGTSGTYSFPARLVSSGPISSEGDVIIEIQWGPPEEETILSGGTPDSLPADAFDGGSPDDLPTDIIDGGLI